LKVPGNRLLSRQGSEILNNPVGTAPGCWIHDGKKMMAMMPGPPREMIPMFEAQVVPRIKPYMEQTFKSHTLRVCGAGESNVEESLRELIRQQNNPTIATYAKEGEVHVRITARAVTDEAADQLLVPAANAIRKDLAILYTVKVKTRWRKHFTIY
jgi:nicotinamide-nucleotide amidase